MNRQALNILMQLPIAVGVYRGKDYTIELVNEKALELWGKTREEILYKPAFDVFPELLSQGFDQIFYKVIHEGESFEANEQPVELMWHGKRETLYLNYSYSPFRNEKGARISTENLFVIKGNLSQLQQAFQNLLSNSLKYAKPGVPPEIKISCKRIKGKDTGLRLSSKELQKEYYMVDKR